MEKARLSFAIACRMAVLSEMIRIAIVRYVAAVIGNSAVIFRKNEY
jgi:hypothetical protein